MSSRRRRRNIFAFAVAIAAMMPIEMARADQTRVPQCSRDMKWMENDSRESPCAIAHFLMQDCATPDSELAILPLSDSIRTYVNPLSGRWCTCNAVVYNLMSACAVCQGGVAADYSAWMKACAEVTHEYPDETMARSRHIPRWAYAKRSNFNRAEAEAAADEDKGWSAIQILLPILIGVAVALLAITVFYVYRRRLKRRYTPIDVGTYPSRPTHTLQDSRLHSQQSIPQSLRSSHHQMGSQSTLGVDSITGRSSPALTQKKSVAWERAHMDGPRRFGGLLPDRRKVHEGKREADWDIDYDPNDPRYEYSDPWHPKAASSSSSGSGHGLRSKEASGDSQRNGAPNPCHSSLRPAGHRRSESELGLLSGGSSERFRSVPNSPGLIKERPRNTFVQGIVDGLSGIGDTLRIGRRSRPRAMVSTPPRRGFNLDGVDSPSPVEPSDQRGSRYKSFVFVDAGDDIEAGPVTTVDLNPVATRTNLDLGVADQVVLAHYPSQSGSSGDRTRSDGSPDNRPGVNLNGIRNTGTGEEEARIRNGVMLISRSPGQDFNSTIISPATDEAAGLGPFSASTETENWPPAPALPDRSVVSLPSHSHAERIASSIPPTPPLNTQANRSNNSSPSHSAPVASKAPSRILIPQGNGSSHLIVPSAIRAAGGYNQPARPSDSASLSPLPRPVTSITSLTSAPLLPNARPLSGNASESVLAEPPSAISNTAAPAQTPSAEGGVGFGSEHSSDAYTVPNPFIFDERRGGSVEAAKALRLASSPRPRSREEIIE